MRKPTQVFLALAIIEGVFSLIWLLAIPSDPKTAWLLGYSRQRILLMALNILGILAFAGLLYQFTQKPGWLIITSGKIHSLMQDKRVRTSTWTALLFVLSLVIIGLWIAGKKNWPYWIDPALKLIGVYLTRLVPLLFWAAALCIQSMLVLWWEGYKVALGKLVYQVIGFMICPGLVVYFSFLSEEIYHQITKEDAVIEWLTVLFFLLTALVAVILAIKARRVGKTRVWFLTLLIIACVLFALEEISWGQRVIGLETSDFFLEHSDQPEINIHNVINEQFSIRTKHVAAVSMGFYGVVIPLATLNKQLREIIQRLGVVISPLFLIPGYTLGILLTWDRFFTGQDEEVAEFFFSLLLFLALGYQFWESRAMENIES